MSVYLNYFQLLPPTSGQKAFCCLKPFRSSDYLCFFPCRTSFKQSQYSENSALCLVLETLAFAFISIHIQKETHWDRVIQFRQESQRWQIETQSAPLLRGFRGYSRHKINGINLFAVKINRESNKDPFPVWLVQRRTPAPLRGPCLSASSVASAQTPKRADANG